MPSSENKNKRLILWLSAVLGASLWGPFLTWDPLGLGSLMFLSWVSCGSVWPWPLCTRGLGPLFYWVGQLASPPQMKGETERLITVFASRGWIGSRNLPPCCLSTTKIRGFAFVDAEVPIHQILCHYYNVILWISTLNQTCKCVKKVIKKQCSLICANNSTWIISILTLQIEGIMDRFFCVRPWFPDNYNDLLAPRFRRSTAHLYWREKWVDYPRTTSLDYFLLKIEQRIHPPWHYNPYCQGILSESMPVLLR